MLTECRALRTSSDSRASMPPVWPVELELTTSEDNNSMRLPSPIHSVVMLPMLLQLLTSNEKKEEELCDQK